MKQIGPEKTSVMGRWQGDEVDSCQSQKFEVARVTVANELKGEGSEEKDRQHRRHYGLTEGQERVQMKLGPYQSPLR